MKAATQVASQLAVFLYQGPRYSFVNWDEMVAQGLEDEARRVLPYRHTNAPNTVG